MNNTKILIVDDELIMRESLAGWLERDEYKVDAAASGEEALKKLTQSRFDIMLVDIKMEGMSGLDVLRRVKTDEPDVAVVMITAYGSISTAIEAMKNGADDYLLKPFDPNELGILIEKIVAQQAQAREMLYLKEASKERARFESMIGQSGSMQAIFELIMDVAATDSTVLITGETGTGKGLAAKAIHSNSPRCEGPFVTVNCGALSVTKRVLSQTPKKPRKGAWSWPMAAPFSWMKSVKSVCACRSICCGSWRTMFFIAWAALNRSRPISV
jgi:DNA-binding NtrC family response regulator